MVGMVAQFGAVACGAAISMVASVMAATGAATSSTEGVEEAITAASTEATGAMAVITEAVVGAEPRRKTAAGANRRPIVIGRVVLIQRDRDIRHLFRPLQQGLAETQGADAKQDLRSVGIVIIDGDPHSFVGGSRSMPPPRRRACFPKRRSATVADASHPSKARSRP